MPIDASIITGIKTPQRSPLETVGKIQEVQKGILSNRMLSQEIEGKEAVGRAITGATNPETGETDWDKAAKNLKLDAKGAWTANAFAKDVLERKSKEIAVATEQAGLDKTTLELSQKRFAALGDWATAWAGLAAKDPAKLTPEAILQSAKAALLDTGIVDAKDERQRDQLLGLMSQFGPDPKANMELLKKTILQSRATSEGVALVLGTPTQVNRGPEILTQQASPLTGEVKVDAVTPVARTPQETAAYVDVYNPVTKQMERKTSGELVGDAPPNQRGAQTIMAAPPLGVAEGETAAAAGSVKQAQELRVAADAVPAQQAALKNIRDTVGSFVSGPNAKSLYAINAGLTQLARLLGKEPPKVADATAAQEEFNKLATQFINQQVGALGGTGTDSKLESATKGTPNEFMSKEGIQNVTSLMMGLNDAVMAKNVAWQKWLDAGNSPGSYGKFQTQFNAIYNPRVFQSVYMTDKQRAAMLGNMSPKDRAQFQKDWKLAKSFGWIK